MSKQGERLDKLLVELEKPTFSSNEKIRTKAAVESAIALGRIADASEQLEKTLAFINWVEVCRDLSKILKDMKNEERLRKDDRKLFNEMKDNIGPFEENIDILKKRILKIIERLEKIHQKL